MKVEPRFAFGRLDFLRSRLFVSSAWLAVTMALVTVKTAPAGHAQERPSIEDAVRAGMQKFVDEGEIAGAVAVVGRSNQLLAFEAVGLLDLEKKQRMGKNALFRIASMTKPVTALAIMILAEQGRLSIEDPVEKHLSEFRGQMLVAGRAGDTLTLKKPTRPISIRNLLTHTSGLPGRMPEGLADLYIQRGRTLAEGVMAFSQRPLDFEPGTQWAYCNPGIDTLGRVIEVLSGQSYEDFLQKRIFEPLGMKDTTFYPTADQLERLATTYDRKDGKLVANPGTIIGSPVKARYPIPAGGLFSTGADLSRLYQMMLGRGTLGSVRILKAESVEIMTKLQTGELPGGFTPGMGFGLGWGVVRSPVGVTEMLSPGSYGHGGAFGTQGWIDPTRDLFVILLIQRTGLPNADASAMRRELQSLAVSAVKSPDADKVPSIVRAAASPEAGFHWPYLTYVPARLREGPPHAMRTILVIPNNTGTPDDDQAVHERQAQTALERSRPWADRLGVILLQPVFPRPKTDWRIYTQALDRDTLAATKEPLRRLDCQLVAMIDHLAARLKVEGVNVDRRVLLFGFSASGMFVNRFVFLQPDRVKAAAIGSPGGWPLAPVPEWQGKPLRYPIGVHDWEALVGRPPDITALARTPLFFFMGEQDTNDSVVFRDSYEKEDETLIVELFGKTPVARWPTAEQLYRAKLPKAVFKLYPGAGHKVTKEMSDDLLAFLTKHVDAAPE